MESKLIYLIVRNKAKLEKLIENDAPYEKILKQSQVLDRYIMIQMKYINKIGVSS